MLLGVVSDTHAESEKTVSIVVKDLIGRGAEAIIHCGDIITDHVNAELFGNLPVFCALTEEDLRSSKQAFRTPPCNWTFTKPGERVVTIRQKDGKELKAYVGHKRSFEILAGSEGKLLDTMQVLRKDHDWLEWVFSGHTHHQVFLRNPLTTFVNPGAVAPGIFTTNPQFALVDTENGQVVFCQIPRFKDVRDPFSIGVIADSHDISKRDPDFWKKLAQELKDRGVNRIIHCGGIDLADIGKEELSDFQVYFNLLSGQRKPNEVPENWLLVSPDDPVIGINDFYFYVDHSLTEEVAEQSEPQMHRLCSRLRKDCERPIDFVLSGLRWPPFLEGLEAYIIRPGDVRIHQHFAVICLPRNEVTLSSIKLPEINNS